MASKANTVKEVREFARRHGIAIAPKAGGSPLMGKGEWAHVFDSWEQAHEYFKKWQWHKVDNNLPFPWDSKINQQIDALNMRSKNPAKSSTKRVALFAANPRTRINKFAPSHRVESSIDKHEWVRYADLYNAKTANELASKLHDQFPDLYIRITRLP